MQTLTPLEVILAFGMMGAAAAIILVLAKIVRTKAQREQVAQDEKRAQAALRKAVERGTHDEQGFPLCRGCGDKDDPATRATEFGFRIERDDGLLAWVRQRIGAPARLRVGRRVFDEPCYCRECALIAGSDLQSYLLGFEQKRRNEVRDGDVEVRRYERVGLDEQLRAVIKRHDEAVKRAQRLKPAEVVALKTGNGS